MATKRAPLYSDEFVDEGPKVLDMMSGNVAALVADMEVIDAREFNLSDPEGKLEYEQFMNDPVVITINETTDDNAPPVVGVGVNGDVRWIPRGIPVRLPRRFIEVLAKSQERKLKTVRNPDPSSDDGMKTERRSAQSYGFAVQHDPHPKGRAWLERVTRAGS